MQVLKLRPAPFDVDDSLVMHNLDKYGQTPGAEFVNVYDPVEDKNIRLVINRPMIRLLKEEIRRGQQVIVWSRGGWEWAQQVLIALKLDLYPIIVMDKPLNYFDDKNVADWLLDRIYIEPNTPYKGTGE